MLRTVAIVVLASLCGLLGGCTREQEASRQMDNYLQRVGRVLDQQWEPWSVNSLVSYRPPSRRIATTSSWITSAPSDRALARNPFINPVLLNHPSPLRP